MIKIYSTPTCPYCEIAKNYFKSKKLEYTEIDVKNDLDSRAEMIRISKQMGVPVIDIDGKIFVGFDRGIMEKELNG